MDSARYNRISEIFAQAMDMPAEQRTQFLETECGNDQALIDEVSDLLRRDEKPSAVDKPVIDQNVTHKLLTDSFSDAITKPKEIGPYKIIDILGVGGMGTVYRAEQQYPSRTVALKVVQTPLYSRSMTRRIEYEAQVLARLQHVGIAQVFEAGTAKVNGVTVPFFAMELVEGRTLTSHAETYNLNTRQKLELIRRVCAAVQHAHRQGVIHRDLKPANVLITKDGQPKVLDFGIARVTDSDIQTTTLHTDVGQLVGTIAYMSPEQVAGDSSNIDTRSDVYALGVLAFELLTEQLPHPVGGKTIAEAARIIQHDNPRTLRGFSPEFQGDLETVVHKALEKDRERRYGSAAEFSADLKRYLDNEPVIARPASLTYQFRKFAQRNRSLVASFIAAFVLLIVAVAGTSYGFVHATRERDDANEARLELQKTNDLLAEESRKLVEANTSLQKAKEAVEEETMKMTAVNTFLGRMLRAPDPMGDEGGKRDMTVVEMLDREVGSIGEAFKDQPMIESAIRTTIGSTYAGLGRYPEAEVQLQIALTKHKESDGPESNDTQRAKRDLGGVLVKLGRIDEAIPLMRESLEIQGNNEEGKDTIEYAVAAVRLGWALEKQGQYEEAERWIRPAIPVIKSEGETHRHIYASAINNLAKVINKLGRPAEAEELYTEAQNKFIELHGPDHYSIGLTMNNIALMRQRQGDKEGAAAGHLKAVEILRKTLGSDHPTLATVINNVGLLYFDIEKEEEAEVHLREALRIYKTAYGADHPETIDGQYALGLVLYELEKFEEAESIYKTVFERRRELMGPNADKTLLAEMHWARCRAKLGDSETTDAVLNRVIEHFENTYNPEHRLTQVGLRALLEFKIDEEQFDECRKLRPLLSPKDERSATMLAQTEGKF
ncbi:MAG: hypothetical protein DHS20C16_22800 [Phycisphaerae bacterium]|nr:MAG: hypothetical protein DHS20C16_22800 [Phycisphaerae bacterium]